MSATTWSKFYWTDWSDDPALKMCSPGAQALWMRMLCVCSQADGYLVLAGKTLVPADMVSLTGWPIADIKKWWDELKRWEVFSVEGRGKIYCRRMVKDARKAQIARENGKNGGNPNLRKDTVNPASDNQTQTDGRTNRPGKPSAISHNEEANASPSGEPAAKAKPRKRPEVEIPDGFPDAEALDDARTRAAGEGAEINAPREAEKFRNHAAQTDRKARDWRAAWRNWVIGAIEKAPKRAIAGPASLAALPKFPNPEIRRFVAETKAKGEAWAVSYLDSCAYTVAGDDRTIIAPNTYTADKLRHEIPELELRGIRITVAQVQPPIRSVA